MRLRIREGSKESGPGSKIAIKELQLCVVTVGERCVEDIYAQEERKGAGREWAPRDCDVIGRGYAVEEEEVIGRHSEPVGVVRDRQCVNPVDLMLQ